MNHAAHIAPPPEPSRHWHPRLQPCAVCLRAAQGFGFFNPAKPRPRKHRWFCSMPCQAWFAARHRKGLTMQGTTEEERLAIAENGYRKVREHHNYIERINTMLDIIEENENQENDI